jgi:hypothetical protein
MTTSRLIVKVATSTGLVMDPGDTFSSQALSNSGIVVSNAGRKVQVQVRTQVVTDQGQGEEIGQFSTTSIFCG